MSATRKMTDKGEGKIGKMKTQEKRLEPRGSGNSANDFPDLTGDGKITMADICLLYTSPSPRDIS